MQKLQDDYQTFTQQMDAPCQAYLQTMMQAVEFKSAKLSEDAPFGYSPSKDAFYYDTSRKSFHDIDLSIVTTHELLIGLISCFSMWENDTEFCKKRVKGAKQTIDSDPDKFRELLSTRIQMAFVFLIFASAVSDGKYNFPLWQISAEEYWKQAKESKKVNIFANYYSLVALPKECQPRFS